MKKLLLISVLTLFVTISKAQNLDEFFKKTDIFLKTNIKNTKVDYNSIKKNTLKIDELIKIASTINISKEDSKTQKSFWINTYNLCVIKGIIDKYPVNSPKEITGFFNELQFNIAGNLITLDNIENKMLRDEKFDNRLHFALICGANGCPKILNQAFMPATLEKQLDDQTIRAFNDTNFIRLKTKDNVAVLPQIFNWFETDFEGKEIEFINKFRKEKFAKDTEFLFYNYDWTLNKVL